jgi:hypothetical protein
MGAAVITATLPVLAADGKTRTSTLGGGTGPYSLSSGTVTTATPAKEGGRYYAVASSSIVGTTLTEVLATPILAGATGVQAEFNTTSNITDAAGNTLASGQTAVATTNNSAVTGTLYVVTSNLDKINVYGPRSLNLGGANLGVNGQGPGYIAGVDDTHPAEFEASCTDVDLVWYSQAGADVSVDGAAASSFAAITSPATQTYARTVASGLASAAHLIRVGLTGSNPDLVAVIVRGGTATITSVAKTQVLLADNVTGLSLTSGTSVVKRSGQHQHTSGSAGIAIGLYAGFAFELDINGTGVDVCQVAATSMFAVTTVDGGAETLVDVGRAAVNNGYAYISPVRGLLPGSHQVRVLYPSNLLSGNVVCLRLQNGTRINNGGTLSSGVTSVPVASAANLVAGEWITIDVGANRETRQILSISTNTLTLTAATSLSHADGAAVNGYRDPVATASAPTAALTTTNGKLGAIGDSVTAGQSAADLTGYATGGDARNSYLYRAARTLGWDAVNLGISGNTSANMVARMADVGTRKGTTSAYTAFVIFAGINDLNTSVAVATSQTNVQSLVDQAKTTAGTGVPILLVKLFSPVGNANLATYNAMLDTVAAAKTGGGYDVRAVSLTNGMSVGTASAGDLADSLHPNGLLGQPHLANNLVPAVSAAGFTTSGTSGTVTVTRAGGSTFANANGTADQITLTASAGTITATAAGGTITNNGTGAVTVKPVNGATSFTYTATATGTITYTNGQNWTNPATTSYTAVTGRLLMKRRRCAA